MKILIVLLVSLIFIGVSYTTVHANHEVREISERYGELIDFYVERFGRKVEPIFVSATILVESSGKPRAFNEKSRAAGLMQIRQIALEQVREAYPHERFSNNLFNPDNNIKVGVAYLTYLVEEYEIKNHDALAVGFSSGPTKGERFSRKPTKNEYVHRIKKMIRLLNN